MKISRNLPWLLLALAILVGSLILVQLVGAQPAQSDPAQKVAAQAPTPGLPILSEERLFDPKLDVDSRAALTEKLEMQEQIEADRAAGAAAPAPKDQPSLLPNVAGAKDVTGQPESGIFPGSDGMVKPEVANILNYWVGSVDGQTLIVMAGSEPENGAMGLVIVMVNDGFSVSGYRHITAPDGVQALRVTRQDEMMLVLEDAQSRTVKFDLSRLEFVP